MKSCLGWKGSPRGPFAGIARRGCAGVGGRVRGGAVVGLGVVRRGCRLAPWRTAEGEESSADVAGVVAAARDHAATDERQFVRQQDLTRKIAAAKKMIF